MSSAATRQAARRILWYGGVVTAVWTVFAVWLVPLLIRQAHRGESIELFNAIMSGRDSHPVGDYLSAWWSLAALISVALVIATLIAWGLVRWQAAGKLLFAEPAVSVSDGLLLAVGLGLASGLLEFLARTGRYLVDNEFVRGWHPDLSWMTPLTLGVTFGILFAPFAVLAVAARRPISVRALSLLLLLLGTFGVIRMLRLGLYPAAAWILAAGLATVLSGVLARAFVAHSLGIRRGLIAGIALCLLAGIGMNAAPQLRAYGLLRNLPPAVVDAPNVLFIILDTVRAQSLSLYGYHRPTSPNLERFAQRGITFDRAFATSSWTLPTHASLFTGRYPQEHLANWETALDSRYPTLAEQLAARGYVTAAFVANLSYTARATGLARGFIHFEDYERRPAVFVISAWLTSAIGRLANRFLDGGGLYSKPAPQISAAFLRWLDRAPQRPFFAFLNYFDAHFPYTGRPARTLPFPPHPATDSVIGHDRRWLVRSLRDREAMDRYDHAIAFLDEQLGRLFDQLDRRALLDNTLVIVTSDHGESFGEHGLRDHGNSLYVEQLHVPLVIVPPRSPVRPGSLIRHAPEVSLRDLPATVMEILDIDSPNAFPGRSLLASGRDGQGGRQPSDVLSHVTPWPGDLEPNVPLRFGEAVSIISDGLHYIRLGNGAEELYAFDVDRSEARNLAGTESSRAVVDRMRDRLKLVLPTPERVATTAATSRRD